MLGYLYEELGDERFQKFAQALIVRSYPNAQCMPVGMPDGGRDAIIMNSPSGETIIFQVKFTKNPLSKDAREVIKDLAATEAKTLPTLAKLHKAKYVLITNVAGTSHPGGGSIDQVNEILSKAVGMPATCWWRDDLDSRISSEIAIQWAFPEILRGMDVLAHLTAAIFKDSFAARQDAIKSYLAAQYEVDGEVKFKQVELQNQILDLFVDIPASSLSSFSYREKRTYLPEYFWEEESDPDKTGISRLLLLDKSRSTSRTVVEGAPGQGKSTVTQYVCQVHRIRILQKKADEQKIAADHLTSQLRIPFRVDLRDFAAWLGGKNPFSLEGAVVPASSSLESFLAFQVQTLSGGMEFSPNDLLAIVKNSPIIIALDGFDEVADISARQQIITELNRASTRLRTHQPDLQLVVTSRPAAFANSPGFPRSSWLHLELQDLRNTHINAYAAKWMDARHLQRRERAQFTALLREKLEQPHTRDLARNPMQLTILLALISARGLSLPDKRTALYDSYMEHFFNRESEKSRIVLDHRDLLIDIHRYVAWILHSRAEEDGSNGAISDAELRTLLRDYLAGEGHNPALIDALFTGMIERVVALVSRVQGTYEFEVQPLREYFVGRHLYETAPYSPAGGEQSGTKTERFMALAKNFYWLNVARFYCGCYSKGELASIVYGLKEVDTEHQFHTIAHPRLLAAMLLADWVFTQQPITSDDVLEFIFDQPNFVVFVASAIRSSSSPFAMADIRSRAEMSERCKKVLVVTKQRDLASQICRIIQLNEARATTFEWWAQSQAAFSATDDWLFAGYRLGLMRQITSDEIALTAPGEIGAIIPYLMKARRFDLGDADRDLKGKMLHHILCGDDVPLVMYSPDDKIWEINLLHVATSKATLSSIFHASPTQVARNYISRFLFRGIDRNFYNETKDQVRDLEPILSIFDEMADQACGYWQTEVVPWLKLSNGLFEKFGETAVAVAIALCGAGIRNRQQAGRWTDLNPWAAKAGLAEILRYARLKSGQPKWWVENAPANRGMDNIVFLATALSWLTEAGLEHMREFLETRISDLHDADWSTLVYLVEFTSVISARVLRTSKIHESSQSPRFLYLLGILGDENSRRSSYSGLADYAGDDVFIRNFRMDMSVIEAQEGRVSWKDALIRLREDHLKGARLEKVSQEEFTIAAHDAVNVCQNANEYPLVVVHHAQRVLSNLTGSKTPSLASVAEAEHWFPLER